MPDPIVIATDFDGVLCKSKWPAIGEPKKDVIEALRDARRQGCILILWTCRMGQLLDNALDWATDEGLCFDHVNRNAPHLIERYDSDPRKVFAHIYLEDRAVMWPFNRLNFDQHLETVMRERMEGSCDVRRD